eukprot:g3175.t1
MDSIDLTKEDVEEEEEDHVGVSLVEEEKDQQRQRKAAHFVDLFVRDDSTAKDIGRRIAEEIARYGADTPNDDDDDDDEKDEYVLGDITIFHEGSNIERMSSFRAKQVTSHLVAFVKMNPRAQESSIPRFISDPILEDRLVEMGFSKDRSIIALRSSNFDFEMALSVLLDGGDRASLLIDDGVAKKTGAAADNLEMAKQAMPLVRSLRIHKHIANAPHLLRASIQEIKSRSSVVLQLALQSPGAFAECVREGPGEK